MKLVHQINLAFGIALVLVLSITAIIIHHVLLDHFMGAQKEELKSMSAVMTASLSQESAASVLIEDPFASFPMIISPAATSVDAILTDENGRVLSTSVPMDRFEIITESSAPETSNLLNIWNGTDKRFITEVNVTPQGTLTLFTPVSKVQAIEQALLKRLLIIFCVVGAFMFLFSLFITKKLIKPLIRLQEELKKVKERHFSDVKLIKASGEIGSVAQSVYEMAGELKRFNHVQKQFFQNASHELKTPLMSISGYAEGIRDGIFEGESVRKGLDIIMSESGRLKSLVTEMTLLAKLDSEEDIFQPTEVCLKDLLIETIERMNPLLIQKGLTLHTSYDDYELLTVHADREKLLQALLNVVSNATRYAKQQIYIHAEIKNSRVEISVTDDGPGIPEDLLPYLFQRFVKGKDGDSGLGLAISRAIVERCGGLITAGNLREGGAVISMKFPAVAHI
ncbi:Signal transduction histidine kinase [Paenibacillus uliginis N3/975]|uniref:histidine kinase n=1 Tax=Paenibacillus uliginis N3/975 TaxID=1313296 RepID=A0A1X7HU87_9BACL|nr:HAMP domain-containing sensor histidine kinase [Paenibacillus uliginis]SMF92005.1 Signal transduction histidine kinase [Paenibacillus uliginis N3/975]